MTKSIKRVNLYYLKSGDETKFVSHQSLLAVGNQLTELEASVEKIDQEKRSNTLAIQTNWLDDKQKNSCGVYKQQAKAAANEVANCWLLWCWLGVYHNIQEQLQLLEIHALDP